MNIYTCLLQIAIGLKWPLSTSSHLPLQVNQGLLANKAHRVPLLPTPDATAGDAFSAGIVHVHIFIFKYCIAHNFHWTKISPNALASY